MTVLHRVSGDRPPVGAARELAAEHRRLDGLFAEVHACARSGAWRECDAIWSGFTRDLEAHMRLEEESFFPGYSRESEAAARAVRALIVEHDQLRALLFRLGVDIQLHVVSARRVDSLIDALRAHARREDETLHEWLERADAAL